VLAMSTACQVWAARLQREMHSLRTGINPRFALLDSCARRLPNYALCSTRAWLYRQGGCDIGTGVTLQGPLRLVGKGPCAAHLHLGAGCILGPFVTFGLDGDISIGRNAAIGPGSAFYTATHAIGFASRRMQLPVTSHPIVVEDGAWIGAECLILPGVRVGRGSVVAAGAVVTENVPTNVFASGNPATVREPLPFGDR
jgi:acetyltransferase-like isoleucine patch superfamily enzyme